MPVPTQPPAQLPPTNGIAADAEPRAPSSADVTRSSSSHLQTLQTAGLPRPRLDSFGAALSVRVKQRLRSGIRPRPLLASEALKEELAPYEPVARTARFVCLGAALLIVSIGVALQHHLGGSPYPAHASIQSFVVASVLTCLAGFRLSYGQRAWLMVACGAGLLTLGLWGLGPNAALGFETRLSWEIARGAAAISLPAALMFRAHYRAYSVARVILACCLGLAVPYVLRSIFVTISATDPSARGMAALGIVAIFTAFSGFMGATTTALGSVWAVLILVTLAAELAISHVTTVNCNPFALTAISFFACSSLATLGLFQGLASWLAQDARGSITVLHHEE